MSDAAWLAEVTWAGEQIFLGSDDVGHSVIYDNNPDKTDRGIGPMRALLATLGACSGMDVVALLKKKKQKLTSVKILLNGERPQQGYPRPYKTIQLKYLIAGIDLNKEYVKQAVDDSMTKFCSVGGDPAPRCEDKLQLRDSIWLDNHDLCRELGQCGPEPGAMGSAHG